MQLLSMIPAKEAKMYTYRLLEHNFLQLRELRKGTGNAAPVKMFFLFHVDVQQVSIILGAGNFFIIFIFRI